MVRFSAGISGGQSKKNADVNSEEQWDQETGDTTLLQSKTKTN
jgi:hypothetical protein